MLGFVFSSMLHDNLWEFWRSASGRRAPERLECVERPPKLMNPARQPFMTLVV